MVWDNPVQYTNRSIPGYRYYVKNNRFNDFFEECGKNFCRIPWDKFQEFIQYGCNLSWKKEDDLYWKKPENSFTLLKNLHELSFLYNKK